ncbi:hypothetical protein BD410DRAFT_805223 [Rickenella mellea]|uniref:Uncharacterized protein n=1 Tax=Rickenella mellea TaxID=50990 RepID=A0A4Y7PYV0_9AGAM|nr:hypothetical protein BD410DRAFT_805223 [Rickenella mellea]
MTSQRILVLVTFLATLGAFAAPVNSNQNDLQARKLGLPQILSIIEGPVLGPVVGEFTSFLGGSDATPTAIPDPDVTAFDPPELASFTAANELPTVLVTPSPRPTPVET